jgi:DNA repair protein SbcC/Rad50
LIILQSIRVRNFRAIKEATFKPLEEGITGIFGPNGAGKTSFLAATLFALYGVRPPGATQSSLRRIGSKDESSVSVVFTHLGQQIEIIREIKPPNNRVVVNIYVDGVPQTVTSVTSADQWVKARLGIDANGFLTAFVVRQKELDQLIQAKPAERKQIIEKLAGIDAINIALKNAREEENSVKKILSSMPGSEQETINTAEIMESSANRVSVLMKEIKELETQIEPLELEIKSFKDKVALMELKNDEITSLISRKESLEESQSATIKELSDMPEVYVDEKTIEELREEFAKLKQQISEKSEQVNSLTATRMNAGQNIKSATALKESIEVELKEIEGSFELDVQYSEVINETSQRIKETEVEKAHFSSKIDETLQSVETLQGSTACPTCLQSLANPEQLIKTLNDAVLMFKENLESNGKTLTKLHKKYDNLVKEYSNQTTFYSKKEQLELQEEIIRLNKTDELDREIDALMEDIKILERDKDSIEERGKNLKETEVFATMKEKLETKLKTISEQLKSVSEKLDVLTSEIGGVDEFQKMKNLNKKEQEYAQHKTSLSEKKTYLAVAQQKHSTDKNNYETAKASWDKKKQLLTKQETMTWTTDMLNKFRTETVSSLAPEISETATGLISEMTNGDFTEIRLDDEFNTYLTDSNGIERPSTWLSGGEESAVALALRIAIAFLITGNNPSLLWLDEVLTAQDADRRSTMLTMIRQLPIQQIIMINHTQEAADIVDKTVEIIPNIIEGSVIKETETVSADIILDL